MATNFQIFDSNKLNMLTDEAYTSSTWRTSGNQPGIAPGDVYNKLFYQTSIFAAAFAQSLSNKGFTVSDGDFNTLVSVLSNVAMLSEQEQARIYKAAGTYSLAVPSWANQAIINGAAGGGGGNASHGIGGGAGECAVELALSVTASATLSIVVGVGGVGASASAATPNSAPGSDGVATTITQAGTQILYLAPGKGGGTGDTTNQWYGGLPGNFNGWGWARAGGLRTLFSTTGPDYKGGLGGTSIFAGPADGGYYAGSYSGVPGIAGQDGVAYGGGGGGGGTQSTTSRTDGGKGADGFLSIRFTVS